MNCKVQPSSATGPWNASEEKHPLSQNLSSPTIPCLNGIRGIAAYMVVLQHTGFPGELGPLAVNIFFVLSGFLITHLLIREHHRTGTVSLRRFYMRRTLRIFPAFYVAWALTLIVGIAARRQFPHMEAVAAFFYMGDYFQAITPARQPLYAITWSLGIEEKFYLFWPMVFLWCAGNRSRVVKAAAALVGIVWVYRFVLIYAAGASLDYVRAAFDARLDLILFGCACSAFCLTPRGKVVIEWLTRKKWQLPLTVALLFAVHLGMQRAPLYLSTAIPIEGVLIASLLIQLITWGREASLGFLNSKPALVLGDLSYSIYLYHVPVGLATKYYLADFRWRYQLAVILIAPVFAAAASHYWIERPFLRLKDRFADKPRSASAVAAGQ